MKLLPHRKTLAGYARRIASAHSAVQIEILRASYQGAYRDRFSADEIEVLDLLCGYKLLQHETAAELNRLREQGRGSRPTLPELQEFAARGLRAQRELDQLVQGAKQTLEKRVFGGRDH